MMRTVSMPELGKIFNVNAPSSRPEKAKKCRKCGADMTHPAGTNVYICTGKKDGKDCGNVFYSRE